MMWIYLAIRNRKRLCRCSQDRPRFILAEAQARISGPLAIFAQDEECLGVRTGCRIQSWPLQRLRNRTRLGSLGRAPGQCVDRSGVRDERSGVDSPRSRRALRANARTPATSALPSERARAPGHLCPDAADNRTIHPSRRRCSQGSRQIPRRRRRSRSSTLGLPARTWITSDACRVWAVVRVFDLPHSPVSSTAMKASCGICTDPTDFMRLLPRFWASRSLRFRVKSPP